MFCQKMSGIIMDGGVDVDLFREFRLVEELLIEEFPCRLVEEFFFAIDFSIKDRTNLLTG